MTTKAAERLYLAQHLYQMEGKRIAIYNPNNIVIDKLPIIYGFNNGGSRSWYNGCLISEDGEGLGGHTCSHESYMLHDLGILEDTRPDRHKDFRKYYPGGYRMMFISLNDVKAHEGLTEAYRLNQLKASNKS